MKITVQKVFIVEIHAAKLQPKLILLERSRIHDPLILAHWTYTREEWVAFHRWQLRKKSWLLYFLNRLNWRHRKKVPEIKITPEAVWTNERNEIFAEGQRHFQRANIRDAGRLNVLEICYEDGSTSQEIRIPIPKGKLREAIELQEKLLAG